MFKHPLTQLPAWAQPDHPVLRYVLNRRRGQPTSGQRMLRAIVQVLALAALILLGYQLATEFGDHPAETLHDVLYWPLVILGVLAGLAAMTLTGNVISTEKARGTWDSLRLTSHGPELTFYTRWISVFYTLRGPLAVLLLARVVLVVGILIDLAQYFRGRYLDLLLSGITPPVSPPVGAALLAATLTAALLQPLVAMGLDAAVGLLISVAIREPRYALLTRTVTGALRVGLAVAALAVGAQVFGGAVGWTEPGTMWGGVLFQSVFGDQALRLLSLENSGLLWVEVPYSILAGPILLIITLGQAWLANAIVSWASRLAERAE